MNTLKPGVTYVYENDGIRIYAREFGSKERKMVGYAPGAQAREERKYYMNQINDILTMSETDPAMKELLDQLFVLYNLKKQYE
jgi:hypothetical protein